MLYKQCDVAISMMTGMAFDVDEEVDLVSQ